MQGRYLFVDGVKLFAVFLDERTGPFLDQRNVAQHVHDAIGEPLAVSGDEKPDAQQAEQGHRGQQHSQQGCDRLGEKEDKDAQEPEPEMAENVGHGIQDNRRRRPFRAYLGRQFHDAVRLAAHQSARGGIV